MMELWQWLSLSIPVLIIYAAIGVRCHPWFYSYNDVDDFGAGFMSVFWPASIFILGIIYAVLGVSHLFANMRWVNPFHWYKSWVASRPNTYRSWGGAASGITFEDIRDGKM